jgi:hypothetical protein
MGRRLKFKKPVFQSSSESTTSSISTETFDYDEDFTFTFTFNTHRNHQEQWVEKYEKEGRGKKKGDRSAENHLNHYIFDHKVKDKKKPRKHKKSGKPKKHGKKKHPKKAH